MSSIQATRIVALSTTILNAHGVPRSAATIVAASLVKSNLLGHDSHGVMRLPRYLDYMMQGKIAPQAQPVVVRKRGTIAAIDGKWAFGQIGARFECDAVAKLARRHGTASVALHEVMHIGGLGEYAEALAQQGFAVLVLTSNGGPGNAVAPFGGRDRIFGTNPMAFAVPGSSSHAPLVVDFATAATAEGKLAVAKAAGEKVEAGALVDRDGAPSVDPGAFYEGGALLPFGAHKGYG